MRRFSFVLSIIFFVNVFVSVVHAEIQTYTGVGEYITDGSDTPDFAQKNARLYAERNACEQAGVFISSRTEVKNSITERDEIEAFTVDIIRVKSDNVEVIPLTGAAKGFTKYRVTVTAEVDTSQFAAQIKQWVGRSEERRQELINQTVSMQRIINSQRQQIAKLEKDLQNIRTAQDRQRVKNEITNVKKLALYSQKMSEAAQTNDKVEKVQLYNEAIIINPNGAEAYFERALCLHDRQQEISDLSLAIEIDPNYTKAYYFRGNRYYLNDNYELALADFTKAIELNPNYVDAYRKRIKIYRKFDNNAAAIADCTKLMEFVNDIWLYQNRAVYYLDSNDYERAIADFIKFLKVVNPNNVNNPKLHSNYRMLGNCYMAIGDTAKAREAYMMSM